MRLDDILNSTEPASLIDPVDFMQADIRGIKILPVCLLGIFNPMGPTVSVLTLMLKSGASSGAILYTSLNPFSQTRLLTARAPTDPAELAELTKSLHKVGQEFILGARPDCVLFSTNLREPVKEMLLRLLSSVPSSEQLSKTNRDFRAHWQDPWSRIPSMEEMMSDQREAPARGKPDPKDFDEWFSIVTDPEHTLSEMSAISEAWTGSIGMVANMPHMPLDEVAAELGALGFPHLAHPQ